MQQAVQRTWHKLTLVQEQETLKRLGIQLNEGGQLKGFLSRARVKLFAGGERGGKSWLAACILAARASAGKLYWLVGPDYDQARQEFRYAYDFFQTLQAIRGKRDVSMPKVGPWEMVLKGGIVIRTRSGEDVRKLATVAPDGIIMCEAAQHDYRTFLRCRGRVAETRGWMVLAGTFEESEDWYAGLWTEFQSPNDFGGESFSLPMYENRRIFPEGRDDPEVKDLIKAYSRIPGMVEERVEGIPVVPSDRYFREFKRTVHIGEHPFDKKKPVYLAVDPSEGVAPYCVIALQYSEPVHERRAWDPIPIVYVIDAIYLPGIDEDIIRLASQKPWYANVHGGSIDVEEPDSRRRWLHLGGLHLAAKKWRVQAGIRRLQSFIHAETTEGSPDIITHLYVDEGVPSDAVQEITKYKQRSPHTQKPHLGCADHFLKALWYELLNRFGPVKRKIREGVYRPRHRRM